MVRDLHKWLDIFILNNHTSDKDLSAVSRKTDSTGLESQFMSAILGNLGLRFSGMPKPLRVGRTSTRVGG